MKIILYISMCFAATLCADYRTWTAKDGRTLVGDPVWRTQNSVSVFRNITLPPPNEKSEIVVPLPEIVTISFDLLSDEDVAFIKNSNIKLFESPPARPEWH